MYGQALDVDRRWFKRFGRTDDTARFRLLCFHHAGGSASMYRHWRRLLPERIDLVAVQLPGRSDRFTERPHERMTALVDDLAEVAGPLLDRPFACFGISMGSRVAWTFAHALRDRSMPRPARLYLACDAAPATDDGTWPWQNRADGLEGYVREMGGTPPEVLSQPELLQALLPALHADLTVLDTHGFHPEVPLAVPVHAFAAADDPVATPERVGGWRTETTADFRLHVVPGGHFLSAEAESQVITTIAGDLA
ncbi:thioesterase domain-containing protein [Actinoplanes sp. NPDC049316]|uniref:thioesterase II family protein n=1 Tax=Actinoplanes sp. NPDC049316 TaxID=3154727 RepID=UPI00341793E0